MQVNNMLELRHELAKYRKRKAKPKLQLVRGVNNMKVLKPLEVFNESYECQKAEDLKEYMHKTRQEHEEYNKHFYIIAVTMGTVYITLLTALVYALVR